MIVLFVILLLLVPTNSSSTILVLFYLRFIFDYTITIHTYRHYTYLVYDTNYSNIIK